MSIHTNGIVSPSAARRFSAFRTALSMSPSVVPVHEYEKKAPAGPTSAEASTPARSPASTTLSASDKPVDAVSACTPKPGSRHTCSIVLLRAPRSA